MEVKYFCLFLKKIKLTNFCSINVNKQKELGNGKRGKIIFFFFLIFFINFFFINFFLK